MQFEEYRTSPTLIVMPASNEDKSPNSIGVYDYLTKNYAYVSISNIYWLEYFAEKKAWSKVVSDHKSANPETLSHDIAKLTNLGFLIVCDGQEDKQYDRFSKEWKWDLSSALFHFTILDNEFETQDFAFHADTASHALIEEKNADGTITTKEKLLVDTAVLNWAGENIGVPSVFSNTEDDTNFKATLDEGSISPARQVVTESFSNFFTERYKLRGVEYKREKQPGIRSLSKYTIDDTDETKAIQITYQGIGNQKLIFGNTYRMILTPEYKNGWAVPFNATSLMPGLWLFF